ncbi:MAG TPA: GGDEF domain-containing protein, partial [Burkholderiaceae bacterium]
YSGLPPGSYRLRVQGSNRDGRWSAHEAALPLRVQAAWHQTWVFRGAAALTAVALLVGLVRLRLRALRLRGERLEAVVLERTTELRDAYRRIETASLTDPLTGLNNRRFLEQAMPADFELAARRHADPTRGTDAHLVLLMLDLDHFKQINDRHGHAAGDAVLVQTAQLLRQALRASDHVVRWGGEEFLVVARFVERDAGAPLAEKLRAAVAGHEFRLPDGQILKRTVSVGFATWPFAAGQCARPELDTLHRVADAALYAAKRSWRDAWVGVELTDEDVADFLTQPAAAVAQGRARALIARERSGLVWN